MDLDHSCRMGLLYCLSDAERRTAVGRREVVTCILWSKRLCFVYFKTELPAAILVHSGRKMT